ncbi:hypothetical protein [Cytobacillus massiliigabonensis]|uniref:hypothetical protein n=1 Tax=Cytobacillus massiliigabonensis TaxID=1871011 RepID=UPI000C8601F3|nr:hypothetical protein [Cytobacillus massiliigabonensis]
MKIIASLPYIIVSRSIDWNKQYYQEKEEQLLLADDKIISHLNEFLLGEIWDISYRASSSENGFFYLHTNRGLFSYHVKAEPSEFISKYQEMKKRVKKYD